MYIMKNHKEYLRSDKNNYCFINKAGETLIELLLTPKQAKTFRGQWVSPLEYMQLVNN